METTNQEKMKRGEFLRSLGLSTSTLMAFYCIGTTMTACGSSSEDDPAPVDPVVDPSGISGNTTGNAINFTIDLTKVSNLKTKGKFEIIGDTIVAFTEAGTYVALARRCTHEGTNVQYRLSQNDFWCPNHQSEFSTTGAVENGPATTALKTYKTSLSTDGNTVTVTA
ncbi:ubiquinol-cytochrome c reductase iron-sulfur subunit [Dyadobacter sp. Leaf189]|uniref:QcrA and Rieske domain-containing protein n=1 Tax=Dyadobacter sp. Leaf189 TaxID=1736295 RepID=UPI000701AC67|nr:Rieske 2Fe-2S domain-containing protein [Dyadobacter sp. Leaf189]KQS32845.1 (2Fe-2S)-binding protein [Dyadobacter sp. Leaf189]